MTVCIDSSFWYRSFLLMWSVAIQISRNKINLLPEKRVGTPTWRTNINHKGLQRTENEIHQHGRGFIVFVHNLRLLRPHKIWQKFCFQFVRGRLLMVPREIKKTTYAKCCRENKAHYGQRESRKYGRRDVTCKLSVPGFMSIIKINVRSLTIFHRLDNHWCVGQASKRSASWYYGA